MRLRTKLAVLITIAIMIVMLPFSLITLTHTARVKEEEMGQRSKAIAKFIAQIELMGAIVERRVPLPVLKRHLALSKGIEPSIAYIVVSDAQGRVIAGEINPDNLEGRRGRAENEWLQELAKEARGTGPDLRTVSVQITDGNRDMGQIKIGFSLRPVKKEIRQYLAGSILLTLLLIALGILAAHVFATRVSKPVEILVEGMDRVRAGDFDTRVHIENRDEIGVLADQFNVMTQGLKEREWIKTTFARYVSRQVAEKILRDKKDIDFEGELRNVTVLFADIREFTALAETLRPKEVVALLNEYFDVMIDIIFDYEGTLDKFIGDQIMAVYGAPLRQADAELRAVKTALKMQEAVGGINQNRARRNLPVVQIGIGINTGEVIAGNIGSEKRMEYTVIGNEVNIAQRIEAASLKGQILISGSTYEAVKNQVDVLPLRETRIKGKSEPIPLYSVRGLKQG